MAGTWEDLLFPWPGGMTPNVGRKAVHMVHLKTGKIQVWGGGTGSLPFSTPVRLWDPDDPLVSEAANNNSTNIFCAGHCALTDGTTLIAGGSWYTGLGYPWTPPEDVNFFDPGPKTWTDPPLHMEFRRWYPTCTTLWDGKVLITSGYKSHDEPAKEPLGDFACNRVPERAI